MGWPKGRTRSAETKGKIATAKRGKTPSAETKAKMAAANTGKTRSPETRAKLAAAKRGKTHSPEARAKMAAARHPFLAGFTEAQRADFKLFRRKGYSSAEARELVLSDV